NDSKPDTARNTDPETDFRQNLLQYIQEVRAKQANPILFTSIPRRKFDDAGNLVDTHGKYVSVVRQLAADSNIPFVDLNRVMTDYVQSLGVEASKSLYLHIPPGKFDKLPDGKIDDTHLSEKGAAVVAELALRELLTKKLIPANAVDESRLD